MELITQQACNYTHAGRDKEWLVILSLTHLLIKRNSITETESC